MALLVLVVVSSGCRTDVDVAVAVRDGGSGTVTVTVDLDAAAAKALGDPHDLALDDLSAAGWRLRGPTARRGGLRVVAVRAFASPLQLAAVLDEVGGRNGVFRGTTLRLEDGFAASSTTFRTRVHLEGDLSELSDPQLTAVLGGLPLGRTPEELAAAGVGSSATGRLTVRVGLPGGVDATNGTLSHGVARWSAPIAGSKATDEVLTASSNDRRLGTLVVTVGGLALVVVAAVVAVTALRSRRDG